MSFKKIAASTTVIAGLALTSGAMAQDSGYYIQGHGGANFNVQDDATADISGLGSFDGSYDAETGYALGAALGKYFSNGLRGDIELTYRNNDIDSFDVNGVSADLDGDISSTALMVNGYYDFATQSAFTPYIGAGIGYANVDAESADEGAFAYQAKAGVSRPVGNAGGQIGAEATYFATSEVEFNDGPDSIEIDYGNTSLLFFYRQAL